ncbi:MAG: xanthine dehydrogenase family protein subunit M [Actinobacteria bacterium]|nr:xanthine dehydrogenase family protein subunit M [Actinomycetota bacterium]
MIPAPFDYLRPATRAEAIAALRDRGEDAKVLAGGQSLIPLLRLRLAAPTALVDISRIEGLRGVHRAGDTLVIGAATSHDEVLRHPLVTEHCPLLAQAVGTVADPAVRHRGTLGGALAHADPAGDLPAVAVALEAQLVLAGPAGERTVPAGEFFVDYLETVLQQDELLTEIRVPVPGTGWGTHYEKFHRVAQAWAIVGVAALIRRDGDTITDARIGLTNMGPTPVRARAVEQALLGTSVHNGGIAAAAEYAAEGTAPTGDLAAQPDYRRHLARVLTRRAVERAAGTRGTAEPVTAG